MLLGHTSISPILNNVITTALPGARKFSLRAYICKMYLCKTYDLIDSYRAGSCTVGSNCCGNSVYYAVYRNPNLVSCYEPAIPGTQLAGTATYPVACFSTVYSQTITPTRVYVVPNPSGIASPTSTSPGQYEWSMSNFGLPQFEYLGCYSPGTINVAKSVANNSMMPSMCASYCSAYSYFSMAANDDINYNA